MKKTAKFAISMPEAEFKGLESRRRRAGKTRSAFVLEAVRAFRGHVEEPGSAGARRRSVKEDPGRYGMGRSTLEASAPQPLADLAEVRRRAMAAAGRFRSEAGDLSLRHDEALADDYAEAAPSLSGGGRANLRRKP